MAKSGVLENDPTMVAKATELKKELQRLVKKISDEEEELSIETIESATRTLCELKELKIKRSTSSLKILHDSVAFPQEFLCPLSKKLMRDPVIVATGQTYDRPLIQEWLEVGNMTCPRTEQVLSHTMLTPNHLISVMISQWCKNHGIQFPDPVQYSNEDGLREAELDHFLSLLWKLSSTLSDQKEAAKELRKLTKKMPSFRSLFGECVDAIPQLLRPLSPSKSRSEVHPDLQEDLITTLLNLSIHDGNKKLVAETPIVVPLLMDALRSGTVETRSNAAAALFTLSALDSNKALIGRSGALKPLIDLLDEGHPLAIKDVASAIFNLCIVNVNKARAVGDGAVRVILKKIKTRIHVDELLTIFAMLSVNQRAIEEMVELDTVPCLLSVIRDNSCPRTKENCIAVLYTICYSDRTKWKELREEERTSGTISELAKNGTSRAKRKANGILDRLNRVINLTHTA